MNKKIIEVPINLYPASCDTDLRHFYGLQPSITLIARVSISDDIDGYPKDEVLEIRDQETGRVFYAPAGDIYEDVKELLELYACLGWKETHYVHEMFLQNGLPQSARWIDHQAREAEKNGGGACAQ